MHEIQDRGGSITTKQIQGKRSKKGAQHLPSVVLLPIRPRHQAPILPPVSAVAILELGISKSVVLQNPQTLVLVESQPIENLEAKQSAGHVVLGRVFQGNPLFFERLPPQPRDL